MKTFRIMLKNELKMSLRGMDMVIFAIIMPIIVLIILGVIFGNRTATPDVEYTFIEQSFGALACISICAGGVMGLPLAVSDYRGKGILKRYQVTPVSPVMILVVAVMMYVVYSFVSLVSLYVISVMFFHFTMRGNVFVFLLGWLLVMMSIFSIGLLVGGVAKNSKTAGIIASALYFPMLIFSGSLVPYEVMPKAMQRIVNIFPLTQGIKILKNAALGLPVGNVGISIVIIVVVAIICSSIGIKFFRWE